MVTKDDQDGNPVLINMWRCTSWSAGDWNWKIYLTDRLIRNWNWVRKLLFVHISWKKQQTERPRGHVLKVVKYFLNCCFTHKPFLLSLKIYTKFIESIMNSSVHEGILESNLRSSVWQLKLGRWIRQDNDNKDTNLQQKKRLKKKIIKVLLFKLLTEA